MGGKKKRITGLVDELPPEIKAEVDRMVANSKYTYEFISEWLYDKGHIISKSSIFRYAKRYGSYLERIEESNREIEMLVQTVKTNPDIDFTDAGTQILTSKLAKRLAMADDEFEGMTLAKAGQLMVQLSRTKAYKDKVRQEQKSKLELAFQQFEGSIMKIIGSDPELSLRFETQIKALIDETKAKAILDEN